MENPQNTDASVRTQTNALWQYGMMHLKVILVMVVLIVIALIIIIVTCIILTSNKSAVPLFHPLTSSPKERIRVYSREEWSALPPSPDIPDLKLPVEMVIIAHTADQEICNTTIKCLQHIQALQKYLMSYSPFLSDIPYNFLFGGDGKAYEGRGWFKKGEHTKFYNNRSIGIGFIGTFDAVIPSQQELQNAQLLIEEGVYLRVIDPNYKLYGACQLRNTDSPGETLLKIISKWPHWTANKN